MNCSNNLMNPGQSGSNATVANGFVCQNWGPNTTAANNLLIGTGTGGSTVSTRGFQVSSVNGRAVTGTVVQGNTGIVRILDNDAEYACASVEYGSTYGIQINTAGGGFDLSNNRFIGNTVTVLAGPCGAYAFSDSSATLAAGVNLSQNNNWICRGISGWTPTANVNCAAMRFDGNQYGGSECGGSGQCGYGLEAFDSQGDYFSGDSADIYIWYDGNASWTCTGCTFNKPSTAISGWHFFDYNNGSSSATPASSPFYFIDPTFTGGAAPSSNNLSAWASSNTGSTFSYVIEWTYTVTVTNTSSVPISGATVVLTDANSVQECNGTTNSSGVFSCVVKDTTYQAVSGSYTTPTVNPYVLQISATGFTTYTQSSKTINATLTETKQLSGGTTQAATPVCSPGSGTYSVTQSVTCTDSSSGAVICYTTNGTTPATNGSTGCTTGTLYSSAISIGSTLTLKAIAGGTSYTDSTVASYTLTFTTGPPAPATAIFATSITIK
jgi:hypothetical protein